MFNKYKLNLCCHKSLPGMKKYIMKVVKVFKKILLLFVVALFVSCNAVAFQKKADGVVVSLKKTSPENVRSIRLQVITDDIVRVTATPEDKITDQKSLITSYTQTQTKGWDVQQSGNTVILKTSRLRAIVSLVTGEVSFNDINGNIILQEQRGGGKTFAPIEVEGSKGYSFRQVFESPADEAFYGLGQHQSDEFNWKGRNEELFQYNTKVSVPFVVSNKNYGILWDNYSITRFGDPRPYANLDQFKLFDKF